MECKKLVFSVICRFAILGCGMLLCVPSALFAATLASDDFTTDLDPSLYAAWGPIGNVEARGGLIMTSTEKAGSCELGSVKGDFPADVTVETQLRVASFERVAKSSDEANCGFRVHETPSGGLGVELFTSRFGDTAHRIVVRKTNPFEKGVEAKLSRQLVPGETVTILASLTGREVQAWAYDAEGSVLAKLKTEKPKGVKDTGWLRLTQFNHSRAEFTLVRVMDNATKRTLLTDSFCGSSIDMRLWNGPAPDLMNQVAVSDGKLVFGGRDSEPAVLPLRKHFSNFEMFADFRLDGTPSASSNLILSFRGNPAGDRRYEFLIMPGVGSRLNGFPSPCIALRQRLGANSYRYLSGPFTMAASELRGSFVARVKADADRLECSIGPSRTKMLSPACSAKDSAHSEGLIAFTATKTPEARLDRYTIESVGGGGASNTGDADLH